MDWNWSGCTVDWCLPNYHGYVHLRIRPFHGTYETVFRSARILCAQFGDMHSHDMDDNIFIDMVGVQVRTTDGRVDSSPICAVQTHQKQAIDEMDSKPFRSIVCHHGVLHGMARSSRSTRGQYVVYYGDPLLGYLCPNRCHCITTGQ